MMTARPVSPRLEDQVMFSNGVRIMWNTPLDCHPTDLSLQVKECNIVVEFNTSAFSMVRKSILDYYREHPDFTIIYVTDTSNTNERVDKFKITKTAGNVGKEPIEFTIKFTNSKTSAVVSGRLSDVYRFVLNDYNDIERLIHCRHTENTLLEKKLWDTKLEPPPKDWSPFITPNTSRRDSLTSTTISMMSDQDSGSADSISESTSQNSSKRRSRQSFLSVDDCIFDSDNSISTDTPPKIDYSKTNGHLSDSSTLTGLSIKLGKTKPPVTSKYEKDTTKSSNGTHHKGVPVPTYQQVTESTLKAPLDTLFGCKIPKLNIKKPRRTASHFMFAVHLVNIQRQMSAVQQAITTMEHQLRKTMKEQPPKRKQEPVDHDVLLNKIQVIIREELRMVKDEVVSSKNQVKCNRELIKRVYLEMNNKINKEVSEMQVRIAKLERREAHKKAVPNKSPRQEHE